MFLINKLNERKNKKHNLEPSRKFNNLLLFSDSPEVIEKEESSLSLSLSSILDTKSCLPYFLQYIEIKGCSFMVQFYSDVQQFKACLRDHDDRHCSDCRHLSNNSVMDHAKSQNCVTRLAVDIYTTYLSNDISPLATVISEDVRRLTISKICQESGEIDIDCFKICCDNVLEYINENYYLEFLESDLHYQYRLNILMNQKVNLTDILYCSPALKNFSEFMETENSGSVLRSWMDIVNFNKQHHHTQDQAMVIYDKYFSLQAFERLDFPDHHRASLESLICSENGVDSSCFNACLHVILNSMNTLYFPNYLVSSTYRDFISYVETMTILNVKIKNKRSDNDSDSERSITSSNLLMSLSPNNKVYKGKTKLQTSRIFNANLQGKDLQKKEYRGFAMGSINTMGRFVPSFDAPDGKKESLLNKLKSKKEEEDQLEANEIARKIVAEINASTGTM